MVSNLRIIIPKSKKDLELLRQIDIAGKLVSGNSYPTKEQYDKEEGN